jgi:hypothetical protein
MCAKGIAQVVGTLPSKHEALNLNPVYKKKKSNSAPSKNTSKYRQTCFNGWVGTEAKVDWVSLQYFFPFSLHFHKKPLLQYFIHTFSYTIHDIYYIWRVKIIHSSWYHSLLEFSCFIQRRWSGKETVLEKMTSKILTSAFCDYRI